MVAENNYFTCWFGFACLCERNYFLVLFVSIVSYRSYLKSTCGFCFFLSRYSRLQPGRFTFYFPGGGLV